MLRDKKELGEEALLKLLNEFWVKADFGYPINESVRVPTTVSESLRTEAQVNLNKELEKAS